MARRKKKKLLYGALLLSTAVLCTTVLLCITVGKDTGKKIYSMTDDGFIPNDIIQDKVLHEMKIDKLSSIYNQQFQEAVHTKVEQLKKQYVCSFEHPLFIMNPYGTSTTGMYIYFKTEEAVTVEYTVSVKDPTIPDFTRKLYSNEDGTASKHHEGQIIGLVKGMENTLTMRLYDKDDTFISENTYHFKVPNLKTTPYQKLKSKKYKTASKAASGLYVVFGYDRLNKKEPRHLLFYDNYGVLRAEIPLEVRYGDVNIEIVNGSLVYACTDSAFAVVKPSGYVEAIYPINGYTVHHDFVYNAKDHTIVMLATKTSAKSKMDRIVSLNLETGKKKEVLDMNRFFSDRKKEAVLSKKALNQTQLDWIHLNSIDIINGEHLIVSSRELSSIIRINNYRTTPRIGMILADPSLWKGTKYSNLVLHKWGSFVSQVGQHAVRYEIDPTLKAGEYGLTMFNNNYARSYAYPKLRYAFAKGAGTDSKDAKCSYFYRYIVDENKGEYRLEKKIAVPYSKVVSYAQIMNNRIMTFSGCQGIIAEYDRKGNLVKRLSIPVKSGYTYRVIKKTMEGAWFNS